MTRVIYVKLHEADGRRIVALCDKDLLGKTLEYDGHEMKISEHFYKGTLIPAGDLKKHLRDYTSINAIGKEAVNSLLKEKHAGEKNVTYIEDVPHVIIVKV